MLDLRAGFSHFLRADPERLHFAAHSHHPWPDVTRDAHIACWDTAARLQDDKWAEVLGPLWQRAQAHVARHLRLPDPATVVFAPNTHEFVLRILSGLPTHRVPRVLTTDGEFHSFARQAARLEEDGLLHVTRVASEPGEACLAHLIEAARDGFDLVWVSEVFFGSGFALTGLEALAQAAGEAVMVVDGYHAFLARPVDWSGLAARAFYLAGGYKYAMAGEGACFLHCPPDWLPRPRATGWYAGFASLAQGAAGVGYPVDGYRFMGATFDPAGLYRFDAAMAWLAGLGVTATDVHAHAQTLAAQFVAGLDGRGALRPERLVVGVETARRGNFLTFRVADAASVEARLRAAGVVVDRRGDRVRVGFGVYQVTADVDRLLQRL